MKAKESYFKEHPIRTIIWIIVGIIIIFAISVGNKDSTNESSGNIADNKLQPRLPDLEPEISEVNEIMFEVINRNDYTWHNVTIIANNYYTCVSGLNLASNEEWRLNTPSCKDSEGRGKIGILEPLSKLEIRSNEGKKVDYAP